MSRRAHRTRIAGGFTMVELMVVIVVIIILMGIILTVGSRVIGGQKTSQTTGVLRTLDRALEEFFTDTESFPSFSLQAHKDIQGMSINDPVALQTYLDPDVRMFDNGKEYPSRPTAAVFIEQVRGFGAVDSIIEGVPDQFMRSLSRPVGAEEPDGAYVRIADTWDHEILYVHPDNALAQGLFGKCTNSRPYFLSAGEDGGFGFAIEVPGDDAAPDYMDRVLKLLDDNLTSTPVGEPRRDETFYQDFRREA